MSGVLRVTDVFNIKGRGLIAACTIEAAPLMDKNTKVTVITADGPEDATVVGIEMSHGLVPHTRVGDSVGLLLRTESERRPLVGSVIVPAGAVGVSDKWYRCPRCGSEVAALVVDLTPSGNVKRSAKVPCAECEA